MSKEFRIGIIAILTGIILYYGFNFLKGSDILSRTSYYYAIFPNIGTLQLSNPVKINGVPVGKVTAVQLIPRQNNAVLVQFDVNEEVTLYESTIAELTSDLLGATSIVLRTVSSGSQVAPGDTLQSQIDKGLEEILESAQPLAQNLNITINRLNDLIAEFDGFGEQLKGTLDSTMMILERNEGKVALLLSNANRLILSLNQRVDELEPILNNTNELVAAIDPEEVKQILANVEGLTSELEEIVTGINAGEGTVGKVLKSDSLYLDLRKTVQDLDTLLIHFDQYPRDFLKPLGRKHEKLKGKN